MRQWRYMASPGLGAAWQQLRSDAARASRPDSPSPVTLRLRRLAPRPGRPTLEKRRPAALAAPNRTLPLVRIQPKQVLLRPEPHLDPQVRASVCRITRAKVKGIRHSWHRCNFTDPYCTWYKGRETLFRQRRPREDDPKSVARLLPSSRDAGALAHDELQIAFDRRIQGRRHP